MFLSFEDVLLIFFIALLGGLLFSYILVQMYKKNSADPKNETEHEEKDSKYYYLILGIIMLALMWAGYFVMRYDQKWVESDTAVFSAMISVMEDSNSIFSDRGVYTNGYGYQVFVLFLSKYSGIPLIELQARWLPFVGILLMVFSSIIFFHALSKSRLVSLLGALMILIQPDLAFKVMRGSHEKLDWPLLMIAVVLLIESSKKEEKRGWYVVLFYLLVYAKVATNVFLTTNFIFAIIVSFAIGGILIFIINKGFASIRNIERQLYISVTSFVLTLLFIFYVYPPAWIMIRLISSMVDKLSLLLLNFEVQTNPYNYISFAWINSQTYFLVSSYLWFIIIVSMFEWIRRGVGFFKARVQVDFWENVDWFLYAGFASQIAITAIIDVTNVIKSANLQVRAIPGFVVFAIALLARGLPDLVRKMGKLSPWLQKVGLVGMTLMFCGFTGFSLIKVTSDPTFNNILIFYTDTDEAAIEWYDEYHDPTQTWLGIHQRLWSANLQKNPHILGKDSGYYQFGFELDESTEYYFVSDMDLFVLDRIDRELELPPGQTIYDNGSIQIKKVLDE